MPMIKKCMLSFLFFSCSLNSSAQKIKSEINPEEKNGSFLSLFEKICVKNIINIDDLLEENFGSKSVHISSEKIGIYNHGGKVWNLNIFSGQFIVALRDDGTCTLHAKRIKQDAVEKDFSDFALTAPFGKTVKNLRNQRSNEYPFHMITYAWISPDSTHKTILTLSTTLDMSAPYQAVASITHIK